MRFVKFSLFPIAHMALTGMSCYFLLFLLLKSVPSFISLSYFHSLLFLHNSLFPTTSSVLPFFHQNHDTCFVLIYVERFLSLRSICLCYHRTKFLPLYSFFLRCCFYPYFEKRLIRYTCILPHLLESTSSFKSKNYCADLLSLLFFLLYSYHRCI